MVRVVISVRYSAPPSPALLPLNTAPLQLTVLQEGLCILTAPPLHMHTHHNKHTHTESPNKDCCTVQPAATTLSRHPVPHLAVALLDVKLLLTMASTHASLSANRAPPS